MTGLFLPWLAWLALAAPPQDPTMGAPNRVLFCTASLGECRDQPAAALDPTLLPAAAGRLAFVDEEGRLMEPTAGQRQELQDLIRQEHWTRAQATARVTTLPDGTQKANFPGGFLVHLIVRQAVGAELPQHPAQEGQP